MTTSSVSTKTSPVCSICGDESSGFHYGVDSCEGCKGFFRRCITQGMHHRCSNNEKCEITPFTRNSCQYCRLKKCFAVGMSREASRLGRRPKKMKDITGDINKPSSNVPIAPYPSQTDMYQMRMADLRRILQQNGTFKTELMEAFIAAQKTGPEQKAQPMQGLPGTESGYSSTSSANSSKCESPVNIGCIVSQVPGALLMSTNSLTTIACDAITGTVTNGHVRNGHKSTDSYTRAQHTSSGLVSVKEESELNDLSPCENVSTPNGSELYFSIDSNDFMNGFSGMMPDVLPSQISSMSDSGLTEMEVTPSNEQFYTVDQMSFIKQEHIEEPVTPNSHDVPLLLPHNNNIPTPSPLQDKPFFDSVVFDVNKIYDTIREPLTETRENLITEVTKAIIHAHFATCTTTLTCYEENLNTYNQKKALTNMGDFEQLDVNPTLMWKQFVDSMVPELEKVVKFCKKLPGFPEISQEDQITLIKQGSFEVLLIRFLLLVDVESNEMFDPGMKLKCTRDVIVKMPVGPFLDEFFNVASQFNPLHLTDNEIAIFAALTIMCPDRLGLSNRKNVAKIQSLFYQSLYLHLPKSHENADGVFHKLLNVIPLLRAINYKHSVALSALKMNRPEEARELPELHKEVFDIN